MSLIVTAHQPNFLPGMSVVSKIRAADFVVWLDTVQYTKGGFTNRNRLPNGSWLTVPLLKHQTFRRINAVQIGSPTKTNWREALCQQIRMHWGEGEIVEDVCDEIERPRGLLVGLNFALLEIVMREYCGFVKQERQSTLDAGSAVVAESEDPEELLPISDRLAMMVAELGGDIYLSGQSGLNYLNEEPFHERGIEVTYWEHSGQNVCILDTLSRIKEAVTP